VDGLACKVTTSFWVGPSSNRLPSVDASTLDSELPEQPAIRQAAAATRIPIPLRNVALLIEPSSQLVYIKWTSDGARQFPRARVDVDGL
jgi:hypothetical protein